MKYIPHMILLGLTLISFLGAGPAIADDTYTMILSKKFDFSETSIQGEMQGPQGFFLQGRKDQSLGQMIKLRSHFKKRLRNSRSGIKSTHR